MTNFPEENGDGPSNPSSKRQRVSTSGSPQNQENENQQTHHQENGNQESQQQANENLETQHQGSENRETQQHQADGNQETQQHQGGENQETQQHQANENQETSSEEEDENQETFSEEEDDEEDDLVVKLSSCIADGSMSMILMDLDSLDCTICCNPLTIPVFQCENGHTACSSCCSKLAHKCPTCLLPIGDNRCRAIEKVLESVRIPCANMRYGCGETITYNKKYEHDKSCFYIPCSCPIQGCDFISSSKKLDPHLRCTHVGDVIRFDYGEAFPLPLTVGEDFIVLQEFEVGVIFIVHHRELIIGNMVTLSCLGPPSSTGEYFYELSTKSEGKSFRFQSYTKSIQSRLDKPPSVGLLLPPSEFFGTSKMIYLDLMIQCKGDCPSNIQSSTNAV
ncbi:unnamed protein product [Dovyalis caffra]|uniref:RING-type E3 ubiquitin transferase n=1 Tax=Dovyalis caffra TaxID=77055 RepID=A0AAV1S407_9ROSI|nr:unnamed protein product [Dovyalis caffra]